MAFLAGASCVSTSCSSAEADKPVDVLTTLGTHRFFDGRMSVALVEERGMILCRIEHENPDGMSGSAEAGPIRPLFEKGSKWFVYPRSKDEVWTFDGRDHLILVIFDEDHAGNVSWHQAGAGGANGRPLPGPVKGRPPEAFLEKSEGE